MNKLTQAQAVKITTAAAISLSLLMPTAVFAETSSSPDILIETKPMPIEKRIEFEGGPSKQKPPEQSSDSPTDKSKKECRTDLRSQREAARKATEQNDKTYTAAVKASNEAYNTAVKAANQARKSAYEAAKALTDKDARKAAMKKAEADYKAAIKLAKQKQKQAKESANATRKAANKSLRDSRGSSTQNGECVKGASTGSFFERITSIFRF